MKKAVSYVVANAWPGMVKKNSLYFCRNWTTEDGFEIRSLLFKERTN